MNHQYNELEEAQQAFHATHDRHFQLFKERSKTTGWLFAGTLVAALLVLFKVLVPFQDLNERIAARSTELESLADQGEELEARATRLARAQRNLEHVQTSLARAPWKSSVPALTDTMRHLTRSYRVLLQATNEDLDAYLRDRSSEAREFGALLDVVDTLPAGFRGPQDGRTRTSWMPPPPADETVEDVIFSPDETEPPTPLSAEELEALRQYFAAVDRARELGLLDEEQVGEVDPAALESASQPMEERDLPQEPAWMSEPPPSIAEAVRTLHVNPVELMDFESFRDRDQFLYGVLQGRAKEEANRVLETVHGQVTEAVVEPLGRTLTELGTEDLEELATGHERLVGALEQWRRTHESDSSWYQTKDAKGLTVNRLGQTLGAVLSATDATLASQSNALASARKATQARQHAVVEEARALRTHQDGMRAQLDQLLPSWAAGFVDVSELVQVFPLLLVLLVIVMAYNAWLVRDLFLLSCRDGIEEAPYASASLWTLVRRGAFRTFTTLFVYLGGAALVWYAFEQSTILMTRWAAMDGATPWAFTGWVADAAPWFGRAVFLAAAGGVVLAILWREPPTEEPAYAR